MCTWRAQKVLAARRVSRLSCMAGIAAAVVHTVWQCHLICADCLQHRGWSLFGVCMDAGVMPHHCEASSSCPFGGGNGKPAVWPCGGKAMASGVHNPRGLHAPGIGLHPGM